MTRPAKSEEAFVPTIEDVAVEAQRRGPAHDFRAIFEGMEVNQSFVVPADLRQAAMGQANRIAKKSNGEKQFASKRIDDKTARIGRIK